jgi:DNA-binding NarL/FixJ family response regulator
MSNVLVIERSPEVRACLTEMLNQIPHVRVVAAVSDAPRALRALETARPDVAITSLKVTGGTGQDMIAAAKQISKNIFTIVFTASPDGSARRECWQLGADAFLRKPWGLVHLMQLVAKRARATSPAV